MKNNQWIDVLMDKNPLWADHTLPVTFDPHHHCWVIRIDRVVEDLGGGVVRKDIVQFSYMPIRPNLWVIHVLDPSMPIFRSLQEINVFDACVWGYIP